MVLSVIKEGKFLVAEAHEQDREVRKCIPLEEGGLKWQLWVSAFGCAVDQDQDTEIDSVPLIYSYELRQVGGKNLMSTTGYLFGVFSESGSTKHANWQTKGVLDKVYHNTTNYSSMFAMYPPSCWFEIKMTLDLVATASIHDNSGCVLGRLYTLKDTADVSLQCGSLEIMGHTNILTFHSDLLKTALGSSSFREGQTGRYTIKEEDMEPAILEDVVRWMYQQPVVDIEKKSSKLFQAADYFQIAELKNQCEGLLMKQVRVENCVEMLNAAYLYSIPQLKRHLVVFIGQNFESVTNSFKQEPAAVDSIPEEVLDLLGLVLE